MQDKPISVEQLPSTALWVLDMINIAGSVDGPHRLQKYAFLLCKTLKHLDKIGIHKDWTAGKYGPHSKKLEEDLALLKKEEMISVSMKNNQMGYPVENYTANIDKEVSDKLKNEVSVKEYEMVTKIFTKILNSYRHKPTIDLLHDIYYKYPQYAKTSKA